jgi:fructose-bisphosphate aldolase class 1
MNARFKSNLPWAVAFSFVRAIQEPALEIRKGPETNVAAAQQFLYHRAVQPCGAPWRVSGRYGKSWKWDAVGAA